MTEQFQILHAKTGDILSCLLKNGKKKNWVVLLNTVPEVPKMDLKKISSSIGSLEAEDKKSCSTEQDSLEFQDWEGNNLGILGCSQETLLIPF